MKNFTAKSLLAICVALFSMAVSATDYVIALPPAYAGDHEAKLYKPIRRFITHELEYNDNLYIYDTRSQSLIAEINLPQAGSAYSNPRYRIKKYRRQLKAIKGHIMGLPQVAHSTLDMLGFLDHLALNVFSGSDTQPIRILIIGNALHRDEREPSFNMQDGLFPSDGHIKSSIVDSIYSTHEKQGRLNNFKIYFLHTNAPNSWYNDFYRDRIRRFWGLFIQSQGGQLVTFTSDIDSTLIRLKSSESVATTPYRFDHTQNKVEMLSARRSGTANSVAKSNGSNFLALDAPISTLPPTVTHGPLMVGIRWKCKADIDIYARGGAGQDFLFFDYPISNEGRYNKDYRSSPDEVNEIEYVEFKHPIDLYKTEVLINFYAGKCTGGPDGAVRVFFNGQIYEKAFHIQAETGNKGARLNAAASSPFWSVISIPAIIGLPRT